MGVVAEIVVVVNIVVVEVVIVENVTVVVLVIVDSLCYLSSFFLFYRAFYPISRWQGGYDDDGDVLRFSS